MPVHIFGHAVNIKKLKKISKKYNLMVIEDAAEALGSFFNKQHLGTFGNFGILSFNGNKIITTGSGGAILTNNKKLYNYAKHIASTAKKPHPWKYEHNDLGYNYRMPSLNASLGLSQILKINKILKYKKQLYDYYCKVFKDNENFEILKEPLNADSNYWLQTLIIKKGKTHAHEYIKYANKIGIQCRPLWRLMHKLEHLKKYPKMNLENSIFHERSIINLPSGNNFKF